MGISCIISPQNPRSASVVTTQITHSSLNFFILSFSWISCHGNIFILVRHSEFFLFILFFADKMLKLKFSVLARVLCEMWKSCEDFSSQFFFGTWNRKKNNWNNFFIDFPFHWTCFQNYFNSRIIFFCTFFSYSFLLHKNFGKYFFSISRFCSFFLLFVRNCVL